MTELTYFRGRVALTAILQALGIARGDEVAVQAFTCSALPEAIFAAGARPCYVDIEPGGCNMAATDLARKLTPRTRAIVVQHTFGIPAELDSILALAADREIPVIEDCCHTLASKYDARRVGTFGVASFYSFEWGKPVVAGLGGCAVPNSRGLLDIMTADYERYELPSRLTCTKLELQYRLFRLLYRPRLYWPLRAGFRTLSRFKIAKGNYNHLEEDGGPAEDFRLRMAPQARRRLGRMLAQIADYTQHSLAITAMYARHLGKYTAEVPRKADTVYARYPLLVPDKSELLNRVRERNIELADWYSTPVHPYPPLQLHRVGYDLGSCPNAERRCKETVTLPTHPRVDKRYIDTFCETFSKLEATWKQPKLFASCA